jgi:hypothetical protein
LPSRASAIASARDVSSALQAVGSEVRLLLWTVALSLLLLLAAVYHIFSGQVGGWLTLLMCLLAVGLTVGMTLKRGRQRRQASAAKGKRLKKRPS